MKHVLPATRSYIRRYGYLERVSEIIKDEMAATIEIIRKNKTRLDRMVNALLKKNKLIKEEMEELLK